MNDILNKIESTGADCYFVGGSVRDTLLGIEVYDYDIEVYNINFKTLIEVLSCFGSLIVNEKFYTIKIKEYPNLEFAIPRVEKTIGVSHTDFEIEILSGNDFCKASIRRDFTINSMLMKYSTNAIIDCYNGRSDLENGIIRYISDKFDEDPLRVLRAIRFSSKLGFEIEDSTLELCREMVSDINSVSNERFSREFERIIIGEYFDVAIEYFLDLFAIYFGLKNYNMKIIKNLKLCYNNDIRCLVLFYLLKHNDLSFIVERCISKKSLRNKLKCIVSNDLSSVEDFYDLTLKFNKEEVILIYHYAKNIDIEYLYRRFEVLSKKYTAKAFIDLGYSGADISTKIKEVIIDELKEEL